MWPAFALLHYWRQTDLYVDTPRGWNVMELRTEISVHLLTKGDWLIADYLGL